MRPWRLHAWAAAALWGPWSDVLEVLENPDQFLTGNPGTDAGAGVDGGNGGFVCTADPGIDPLADLLTNSASCAMAGCHAAGSLYGVYAGDLSDLVDVDSSQAACEDGGTPLKYIDSANPANSLIITKLADPPPCGSPMPLVGWAAQPNDIACITEYVEALAAGDI